MNLNGHMDRIAVPFLVTHGANDRQINVKYADDLYDQLVNSPRREKVVFTSREGGVEHVGADNMAYGRDLISRLVRRDIGRAHGMMRRIVDLSIAIDPEVITDPPFMRPSITRQTHRETVAEARDVLPRHHRRGHGGG
ncbi:Uncharacterised protein [Sphingomonas paucimobilis]|nr:Uncharacterised protein [Sphingomonas paucimobilis]